MVRHRFFAGLVVGLLALSVPSALPADEAAAPPQGDGHTVKKGDTLWDLSGEYLENPFNWPDLWKANPQVKDPDLIYPGEILVIPGGAAGAPREAKPGGAEKAQECVPPGPGEYSLGAKREAPFVDMGQTFLREPVKPEGQIIVIESGPREKQPLYSVSSIMKAGFIADNGIKTMAIAGSPQVDRHIFTLTEEVYVADDGSLKPGDRLMTFRPNGAVSDPGTEGAIGNKMVVSGLLDVKSRRGKYALAEVASTYTDIKISDRVVRYTEPHLFYDPAPRNPKLRGKWGYIAALPDDRVVSTLEGVVYLGIGSEAGVRPGDSFSVRRSGGISTTDDGYFDPRKYVLPDVKVGDLLVLSVQPTTATAVLTSASEPIKAGYRAYYEK